MKINVQESRWNNKMCYLGFLDYRVIAEIINSKQDLAMNRKVRSKRVDEIVEYINENIDKVFFPPVILNSCEKINTKQLRTSIMEIELKRNSLTIIDGQHRISAIKQALSNPAINERLKIKKLPFLLIENLDISEHRNLFNLINENATNVEATVSARFKICSENMYGLRYIRKNLEEFKSKKIKYCVRDLIEWEIKQSNEKVCYIFVTDMNKRILKFIQKNFSSQSQEEDYATLKVFWDKYFGFLFSDISDSVKSFYVKKVTLRAIVDSVLGNIESFYQNKVDDYESLNAKIETVLDELLLKDSTSEYQGSYKQCSNTYREITKFLIELYSIESSEEGIQKVAVGEVSE